MLDTIDVLIGFAVVMLILSAIVTMLVQWVITTLLNLKGRVLKEGVAHLLRLLDKQGLTAAETDSIADNILRNSLVGKKKLFRDGRGLANVIHREELAKLILDFAAHADLTQASLLDQGQPHALEGEPLLRARLLNSLRNNGVADPPSEILKAVRATMLALEQSQPELANDARQSLALLTHVSSEFLAKLNAWFDQTIDRTVETFTGRTRIWTLLVSALVAIFFQVDSFDLIKRLSTDKEATAALVNAAIANPESFQSLAGADQTGKTAVLARSALTSPTAAAAPDSFDAAEALKKIKDDPDLKQLVDRNLLAWPASWDEWMDRWTPAPQGASNGGYSALAHLVGVLLTMGLLSLGAPIWYEILKNLIQLRSVVARKDDAQRTMRQTGQQAPHTTAARTGASAAPPPIVASGERGDLEAVG